MRVQLNWENLGLFSKHAHFFGGKYIGSSEELQICFLKLVEADQGHEREALGRGYDSYYWYFFKCNFLYLYANFWESV